ncbi:hypothetical protein AB205_0013150 [Aquarana catesbeiana]|uniref:BED-type domain-containing protein n=1 Tax=Aquarana catesbeiana TaxID=8400 RepID=A0A2G9Q9J9_AQUCT|nr:hypothetical protein AB205_0013150 [Aquarana catesbeiana]
MSGRPTRRGRQSQANKRGQAGSVSRGNSAGRRDGAFSSACGRVTCLAFFSAAGHVEPQHVEDLVEWMTKPSSSSSSSLTQAQGTLSGKAAANVASSLGSMASVTPSLAPPCPPELFDHSVGYMLQEDAQRLEGSDDDTELDEGSNMSMDRGCAQEGQQSGSHAPPAAAYCQVCSSDEKGGDDEVSTWVPDRRQEEEEAHHQRGRMPSRGQPKGITLTASHRKALHVQGAAVSARYSKSSLVWAFFETMASDCTAAICNICLKRISCGQSISHLGTTCFTRHMLTCHAVRWQTYLKDPHQRTKRTSTCSSSAEISNPIIPSVLSETCTERNEGVELGVSQPSTCGQSAFSTPTSNCTRQISLPQLLHCRKKFAPSHPHAQRLNASLAKLLALQLLPFQLVDSAPFREFVEYAVPQWQVPKSHFFSRKAIPALYLHVDRWTGRSAARCILPLNHSPAGMDRDIT